MRRRAAVPLDRPALEARFTALFGTS
jgi:hypothetical protein